MKKLFHEKNQDELISVRQERTIRNRNIAFGEQLLSHIKIL